MARQLAEQGEKIGLLVVFDAQNPAYYEDFSQESRGQLLRKRVEFQFSNLRREGVSGWPISQRSHRRNSSPP